VGFEDVYTLLGSKHFVKELNIPPIMHTTENTNVVVKSRKKICVSLALATTSTVIAVTRVVQPLFTI
jgi:hypothetical protein